MADVAFGHQAEPHAPPTTRDHPSQWHYVATRLVVHMGTYSPDEMNGLHSCGTNARPSASVKPCTGTTSWPSLGPQATRDTPRDTGDHGPERSRSPEGKRHAMTPREATRGHHPVWVRLSAHTEAPPEHSHRGGTEAALMPPDMKGGTPDRHQEARPPQHGELSSMRVRTEAVEAPTTRRPDRHHLPLITVARPRGPAPSGRISPRIPRLPSERVKQRSTRAPTRQQTVHPARPPPPSQSHRPVRCQGDGTPRTRGHGDPQQTRDQNRGWGDEPLKAPPRKPGVTAPAPDTGIGHPTNRANARRGSPAWL